MWVTVCSERSSCPCFAAALSGSPTESVRSWHSKVLITFNYKEGTQTVTFGETTEVTSKGNGSDLNCIPALSSDSFQKGCRFSFLYPSFWKRSAMRIRGLEQQRRPLPAAETGRSCWGRVLLFQSPVKGLRKNQQTQPARPCRTVPQAISPVGLLLSPRFLDP